MIMEDQPGYGSDFPNSKEQAEALLDSCEGDIREAQIIAATNLRFATDLRVRQYWSSVEALVSKRDPSSVVSPKVNEETESESTPA